ncbi:MAG: BtpA/SgcQ family protein [Planctomycetota bacterium]
MPKLFLGVVHLQPLPSSARGQSFETVLDAARRDADALRQGGVDGLIVENFGDAPFHKGTADDPVPPDVPAALAVVGRAVGDATGLPVGINCLRNDAKAALGAAACAAARWVRVNVLTGTYVADQGLLDGDAAGVLAYRKRLGIGVDILADLLVKHAVPLAAPDVATAARDLAERSGASGLIVSGDRTGAPPSVGLLDTVRTAVDSFPIWLGSGLSLDNAADLWPRCDGAIVGSALKRDGVVTAPVDPERVARLRGALAP